MLHCVKMYFALLNCTVMYCTHRPRRQKYHKFLEMINDSAIVIEETSNNKTNILCTMYIIGCSTTFVAEIRGRDLGWDDTTYGQRGECISEALVKIRCGLL